MKNELPLAAAAGIVVALLVLSSAALPSTALAGTGAAGGVPSAAGNEIRQTDGGDVEIRLDADEVNANESITVFVAGVPIRTDARNATADPVTYLVPAGKLPDRKLSSATVRVNQSKREIVRRTLDLRYARLKGQAHLVDGGDLFVPAASSIGMGESEVELTVNQSGRGPETVRARFAERGDETGFVMARQDVERFLLPPRTLTIGDAAPSAGARLVGSASAFADPGSPEVLIDGSRFEVRSRRLVAGESYAVIVETANPGGRYVAEAKAEGGRVAITNAYLPSARSGTLTVRYDGESVTSSEFESAAPLTNVRVNRSESGTIITGAGFGAATSTNVSAALLWTADDVLALNASTVTLDRTNETLTLGGVGLDKGGRYALALTFADGSALAVETGDESRPYGSYEAIGADENASNASAASDGLIPGLSTGDRLLDIVIIAGLVLLLLVALVVGYVLWPRSSRASGAVAAGGTPPDRRRSLSVRLTDEMSGKPFGPAATVTARRGESGTDRRRDQSYASPGSGSFGERPADEISGGRGTIEVGRGTWRLKASYLGVESAIETVTERTDVVDLTMPKRTWPFEVVDEGGDPIPDAALTLEAGGSSATKRTDDSGRVPFDFSVALTDITVRVDHDRYVPRTVTAANVGELPERLDLEPESGDAVVTLSVDGVRSDAADVTISPADEWLDGRFSATTEAVSSDGSVRFDGLPVGRYEVAADVDGDDFASAATTLRVGEDGTARAELSVSFTYDLSEADRRRLADLRERAEAMVPSSQLDTAVHWYYASAVESLADAIARLPDHGEAFARAGTAPDAVVDALLTAGEDLVDALDDALNTKHNVDLFSACARMPYVEVTWDAGYDPEAYFSLLALDRVDRRNRVRDRIASVDALLDGKRQEVTVLSPAQDPFEGIRDLVRSRQESDPARSAAAAFAVLGALDAVEALFDRPELLDRLDKTVY